MSARHVVAVLAIGLVPAACAGREEARTPATDTAAGVDAATPAVMPESAPSAAPSAGPPMDSGPAAPPAVAQRTTPAGSTQVTEPRLEGVVGTVGEPPAMTVVIRPSAGGAVAVEGALAAEVGRLTGATLAVYGQVRAGTPYRTVAPTGYEIVAIDGEKPHVGVLRVAGESVRLEGGTVVRLEGAPEALRNQAGATVYVLGPLRNGVVTVQSFGVIRPPSP